MRKTVVAPVLLLATVVGLSSCNLADGYKESQGNADAPIARTERDGWTVMASPDHFPNIAFRCFGPNGLYNPKTSEKDTSRQLIVVPNDPQCKR
jgi:hypothetical protein